MLMASTTGNRRQTHPPVGDFFAPFERRHLRLTGPHGANVRLGRSLDARLLEDLRAFNRACGHPRVDELLQAMNESVLVTTAHQPVLFGGPLYIWVKSLATHVLAEGLRRQGLSAVPLMWVGADDHDRDEVASFDIVLPGEQRPVRLSAAGDARPMRSVGAEPASAIIPSIGVRT